MTFSNPIFKTPKVRQFVNELIHENDCRHFDNLAYSDQCEFTALLIEASGRNGEIECLTESPDLDRIIGLLKKSLKGSYDDDENLLFFLKENAVNYYKNTMENIFNETLNDPYGENI